MVANLICLVILRVLSATGLEVWQYLGTLGTLAILVGYGLVNVGAARAVFDRSLGVAQWRGFLPSIAVILVGYVLYANIYPAPSFPFNLFPYILLAWLVIGAAVIAFSPNLVRRVAADRPMESERRDEPAMAGLDHPVVVQDVIARGVEYRPRRRPGC